MAVTKKRGSFYNEQEAAETEAILMEMMDDEGYITEPSYSSDSVAYPDNAMPFVDKHMRYLRTHAVEPQQYLSNLRLMIRVR